MTPAQAVKTQKQKNNRKTGKDANAFLNLMASNSLCNNIISNLLMHNENKGVNTGLLDQWALFDTKEQSVCLFCMFVSFIVCLVGFIANLPR